jgi:hypothetical protein
MCYSAGNICRGSLRPGGEVPPTKIPEKHPVNYGTTGRALALYLRRWNQEYHMLRYTAGISSPVTYEKTGEMRPPDIGVCPSVSIGLRQTPPEFQQHSGSIPAEPAGHSEKFHRGLESHLIEDYRISQSVANPKSPPCNTLCQHHHRNSPDFPTHKPSKI